MSSSSPLGAPRVTVRGYTRRGKKCGDLKEQRKKVEDYFERKYRLTGEHDWGGFFSEGEGDKPILYRHKFHTLLGKMNPGDILLIPWFGVLFRDLDDALTGIPPLHQKRLRIVSAMDRVEITSRDLRFLRGMQREWYVGSKAHGPELLGMRRGKQKNNQLMRRSTPECLFMQYCWRLRNFDRYTVDQVVAAAHRDKRWRKGHPRTGAVISNNNVERASEAYQAILAGLWLQRQAPSWIHTIRSESDIFNETQDDLRRICLARLRNAVKAASKREKT